MELNSLSSQIIGAAIEVHKGTGPGLLESTYEQCLCYELSSRGIPFECQKPLPVRYKMVSLDCGYRLDFLVANSVVVELKACEEITKIHEAQLLTYMKLGGWKLGLLINFNVKNSSKELYEEFYKYGNLCALCVLCGELSRLLDVLLTSVPAFTRMCRFIVNYTKQLPTY